MLQSGDIVGHYQLDVSLGAGGFGTVWKAFDHELDRYVALKFLHAQYSENRSVLRRFKNEGAALAALKHPNIVQVHAVLQSDGSLPAALVMEYVDGNTLQSMVDDDELLVDLELTAVGAALADALGAAHNARRQIIHRDVKPANIVLRAVDRRPMLLDFGIALIADATRDLMTGGRLGTRAFMAPEQLGGGDITPATDVYSLGLTLKQLRTDAPGSSAVTSADEVTAVLERATQPDPVDRYRDGEALATALRKARSTVIRSRRQALAAPPAGPRTITAPTAAPEATPAAAAVNGPSPSPLRTSAHGGGQWPLKRATAVAAAVVVVGGSMGVVLTQQFVEPSQGDQRASESSSSRSTATAEAADPVNDAVTAMAIPADFNASAGIAISTMQAGSFSTRTRPTWAATSSGVATYSGGEDATIDMLGFDGVTRWSVDPGPQLQGYSTSTTTSYPAVLRLSEDSEGDQWVVLVQEGTDNPAAADITDYFTRVQAYDAETGQAGADVRIPASVDEAFENIKLGTNGLVLFDQRGAYIDPATGAINRAPGFDDFAYLATSRQIFDVFRGRPVVAEYCSANSTRDTDPICLAYGDRPIMLRNNRPAGITPAQFLHSEAAGIVVNDGQVIDLLTGANFGTQSCAAGWTPSDEGTLETGSDVVQAWPVTSPNGRFVAFSNYVIDRWRVSIHCLDSGNPIFTAITDDGVAWADLTYGDGGVGTYDILAEGPLLVVPDAQVAPWAFSPDGQVAVFPAQGEADHIAVVPR